MDKLDDIIEKSKDKIKSAKVDTKIQCYTTMIIEMPGQEELQLLIITSVDNVEFFKLDFDNNDKERERLDEDFIRNILEKYKFTGPRHSLIGDIDIRIENLYETLWNL